MMTWKWIKKRKTRSVEPLAIAQGRSHGTEALAVEMERKNLREEIFRMRNHQVFKMDF